MSDCHRRLRQNACHQMKLGQHSSDQRHQCPSRDDSHHKYNENLLEQMEKETEEELEMAKEILRNTENGVRHNQKCCHEKNDLQKRPTSKPSESNNLSGKEAIKRLSKVAGKDCESKSSGRSRDTALQKLSPSCAAMMVMDEGNQLPKKPELTSEEIGQLIDQETKDVESAWILTNEAKETFKKPCPKQQRAREAVRAIMEPKKEDLVPLMPLVLKETPPLMDPDPDDISPEVLANMMYTQERGIRMISCPEEIVKHLFPEQFSPKEKRSEKPSETSKDEDTADETKIIEGTEDVDDSAFTRAMSRQKDSGEDGSVGRPEMTKSMNKKEYVLQERAPKYINRVQMRGNFSPWFPGYFVAFPDQGVKPSVQLAKSPSGIFQKAWLAAKPENVPESELYAVQ